jgi:hypothetical protein
MLGKLFNLCDKVIKLDENIIFVQVCLEDNVQEYIVGLNRYDQLYQQGINVDGNVVGYYTKLTEELSGGKKKAGDEYNFFDSGDFYQSFRVNVYSSGEFTIDAKTQKSDGDISEKFERKSGAPILGLTKESKGKLIEFILSYIIKQVKENLK